MHFQPESTHEAAIELSYRARTCHVTCTGHVISHVQAHGEWFGDHNHPAGHVIMHVTASGQVLYAQRPFLSLLGGAV